MKQMIGVLVVVGIFAIETSAHSVDANKKIDSSTQSSSLVATAANYGISCLEVLRNVAELLSHTHELYNSCKRGELTSDIDNLYHSAELAGHIGNIANYITTTTWYGSLALIGFNVFAARAQYNSVTRNAAANGIMAKGVAIFGSLDFVGHIIDAVYSCRSFWRSLSSKT